MTRNFQKKIIGRFKTMLGMSIDLYPRCFSYTGTIFIHIPKNAGQSIGMALYGHTIHHYKASDIKKKSRKLYDESFVFSCVRDPVDRFVSAYSYLCKGGRSENDKKLRDKYISGRTFEEFVSYMSSIDVDNMPELFHFHTQSSYVCDPDSKKSIIVDRVYNISDIEKILFDFKRESKKAPVMDKIPTVNKSEHPKSKLADSEIEKIKKIYNIDYVNFF